MTIEQLNNLKVGDWLVIAKPKSPAAQQHRQQIVAIEQKFGCLVATLAYYDGDYHNDEDNNDCELNMNLFGSMEVLPRET